MDARNVDIEFAIDMGLDIKNRTMGATLAELAKKGRARIIATRDGSKAVVQMVFKPEDFESAELNQWVEYWRQPKRQ